MYQDQFVHGIAEGCDCHYRLPVIVTGLQGEASVRAVLPAIVQAGGFFEKGAFFRIYAASGDILLVVAIASIASAKGEDGKYRNK